MKTLARLLAGCAFLGVSTQASATTGSPSDAGPTTAEAATPRVETRLNQFTESTQAHASLTTLADGSLYAVWDSRRQRNGRYGVFGRWIAPTGESRGEESGWVGTESHRSAHEKPSVVSDGRGLLAAWTSTGGGTRVTLSRQGTENDLGPSSTDREAESNETWVLSGENGVVLSDPALVALEGGGGFLAWVETPAQSAAGTIRGASLSDGGEPGPVRTLVSSRHEERLPAVSPCGDGFVLVWARTDRDDGRLLVVARRFDGAGLPTTAEVPVNETGEDAIEPNVHGFEDGSFVVGWMELHESTDYDPMIRSFSADGTPRTGAVCASADPNGWQSGIALTGSAGGDIAVAWTEYRDAEDADVEARVFTRELDPRTDDFRVTIPEAGRQTLSGAHGAQRIAWLPDGRIAVVWNGEGGQDDATGVYLSLVDPWDESLQTEARTQAKNSLRAEALASEEESTPVVPELATSDGMATDIADVANVPSGDAGAGDLARAGDLAPPGPIAPPVYSSGETRTDLDPEPFLARGDGLGFIGVTSTGWSPPDPHMAVGPDHVVLCTNGAVAAKTKGGVALFEVPLEGGGGFWGEVGAGGFVFDPEASYDVHEERFYVMANERVGASSGHILLAVSSTGDPTDPWYKYRFDVTSEAGAWDIDSPNLAYDADAIYVTADFFSPSDKYFVFIVEKSSVLGGGSPVTNSYLRTGTQSFGIPEMYSTDAPRMYLIEHFDGGPRNEVRLWAIDDPFGSPSIQSTTVSVPTYYVPGYLRSRGTSVQVYLFEARFWSAMYRNGSLWACHHMSESTPLEAKARWYEFEMNGWPSSGQTPSLRQSGTVDPGDGIYTTFNSIAADEMGNAYMVFARSSVDEYFSIARTYRLASDPLGSMSLPETIKASSSAYTGDRWGDYSQVNADPVEPGRFWSHHEYSPGGNAWYTWVQSETVSDPAAVPELAGVPGLPPLVVFPNPTRSGATFRIPEPDGHPLGVSIHDASGRTVTSWRISASGGGTTDFHWDGTDQSGRPVPNGVYSVVVQGARGRVAGGRVTVAR